MKRLIVLAASIVAMQMMTGCVSTYLNDETVGADGKTTKEVTFYRGGVVTSTQFDTAEVNYQGVVAKVGGYSNKGDAELVKEISAGVVGGFIAYSTGGLGAVPSGVEAALKAYKAKASATNATDAACDPVTDATCEPSAGASGSSSAITPAKAQTARKPIIKTVQGSSADVAAGKVAVVILGNRKGCGLCRALWKPTFESDVEKALPTVDVVDADLTDNPKLYSKYLPSEKFVYPYAIVFDTAGKRVGAFTARGVDAASFAAKVSEICTSCKP